MEVAGALRPGTALDLGSGYGDDAVWLARQGWRVLGVDVAAPAIARSEEAAGRAEVADRVSFERHDLAGWFPTGTFDLVTTHYLHSPSGLPRGDVLRRAAAAVAPGGTLLVVGHASLPPWAWKNLQEHGYGHDDHDLPSPEAVWHDLGLGDGWEAVRLEVAPRPVTGPEGEQASMDDSVVVARRAGAVGDAVDGQASASSPSSSRSTSPASV